MKETPPFEVFTLVSSTQKTKCAMKASLVNTLSNVGVYSQPHFGFDGKQTSEASPQRQKTHGTFPLSTRTSISYLIKQNCFDCVKNKMVLRYDYSVYRNFSVKNKGQSDSNLVKESSMHHLHSAYTTEQWFSICCFYHNLRLSLQHIHTTLFVTTIWQICKTALLFSEHTVSLFWQLLIHQFSTDHTVESYWLLFNIYYRSGKKVRLHRLKKMFST